MEPNINQNQPTQIPNVATVTTPLNLGEADTVLLFKIVDGDSKNTPYTFTAATKDGYGDQLDNLLQLHLVTLSTSGSGALIPTQTGRAAVSRGTAVVHGFGPNQTASSYVNTLVTQSMPARVALISSIITVAHNYFSNIPAKTIDRLISTLVSIGLLDRLAVTSLENVVLRGIQALNSQLSQFPPEISANIYLNVYEMAHAGLLQSLQTLITEVGDVTLNIEVIFPGGKITRLYVEGSYCYAEVLDLYTQAKSRVVIERIAPDVVYQLIMALGSSNTSFR